MVTSSGAAPGSEALTRFSYTEYHMGVDARLVVYAPDQTTAEDACTAAFARIAALDSIMSDYRPNSELMRLCRNPDTVRRGVRVSPELFLALRRSQAMARASGGAFDITAGPLIRLWRQARRSGVLPDAKAIAAARKLIGWRKLILDERRRTVRFAVSGMQLDLGGIGKGYADDAAQHVLLKHGITRALVEMGGDIVVTGPPPGTEGWTIRVPNAGDEEGPKDLHFANRAISTSGDTEQFAIIGGKRYSHVVDPRTGQALMNRVEITVTALNGLISDPLSTALTIVGREGRNELLEAYPATTAYMRVLPLDAPGTPPQSPAAPTRG